MEVRRNLTIYGLIAMGLPLGAYLAAVFGNDKIKSIVAVSMFIIAVIIIFFSKKIVHFMFCTREHGNIDGEFLVKISCALVIIFFTRYIVANISSMFSGHKDLVMCIVAAPIWMLIFIPMLNNYCLNKQTVYCALIVSFVIIYVAFPTIIYAMGKVVKSDDLILDSVYYNYCGYTYLSNKIIFYASDMLKLTITDKILGVLKIIASVVIWCIMYVPYIVMSAVWVDERSYLEKGEHIEVKTFVVIATVAVIGAGTCVFLGMKGVLSIDYVFRHNI